MVFCSLHRTNALATTICSSYQLQDAGFMFEQIRRVDLANSYDLTSLSR